MNILQSIFTDYYEHIVYELHPRPAVIQNVDKMIHCGDPSHGGAMYACSHCGNLKFVPFRCKSRFCPSCGNKYNQLRSFHMSSKPVSCVHRHCVSNILEELRIYFLRDCKLLNLLFSSVRDVVLRMFHDMNKKENFTPVFFILSDVTLSGILIFMPLSLKVVPATLPLGVLLNILIIPFCAMPFAKSFWKR